MKERADSEFVRLAAKYPGVEASRRARDEAARMRRRRVEWRAMLDMMRVHPLGSSEATRR